MSLGIFPTNTSQPRGGAGPSQPVPQTQSQLIKAFIFINTSITYLIRLEGISGISTGIFDFLIRSLSKKNYYYYSNMWSGADAAAGIFDSCADYSKSDQLKAA